MSRKAIWVTLTVYLVVALAFALFMTLTEPFALSQHPADLSAKVVGMAASVLFLSGILPLLAWAIGRFRRQHAGTVLTIWAMLGIAVIYLNVTGSFYDRPAEVERVVTAMYGDSTALSPPARAEFLKGVKASCVVSQRNSAVNRLIGITEQQIDSYCDCTTAYLANAVTSITLRAKIPGAAVESAKLG